MSILGVNDIFTGSYQGANKARKTVTSGTDFVKRLQSTGEVADTSKVEAYRKYLEQKYGPVTVKDVGKDQRSIDAIGASTSGYNNVVIAPNILERMANDPEKAVYYESKIQAGLDNFPKVQAQLSAAGFEIYSYGVGIEADGTVYTYTCGDLKPEVRAKIEAKIKAEQEERRNQRIKYQRLSQEAAEKRKQEMEIVYKQRSMSELIASQVTEQNRVTYMGVPETMVSAITAYVRNSIEMTSILK